MESSKYPAKVRKIAAIWGIAQLCGHEIQVTTSISGKPSSRMVEYYSTQECAACFSMGDPLKILKEIK